MAHYLEERSKVSEPTLAMAFGSAFHCRVLTPNLFNESYAVSPTFDRRTKEGKKEYAEFVLANAGKTFIESEDLATLSG